MNIEHTIPQNNNIVNAPDWWRTRLAGAFCFIVYMFSLGGIINTTIKAARKNGSLTALILSVIIVDLMYISLILFFYFNICYDIKRINSFLSEKVTYYLKIIFYSIFCLSVIYCAIIFINTVVFKKLPDHPNLLPVTMGQLVLINIIYYLATLFLGFIPSRKTSLK